MINPADIAISAPKSFALPVIIPENLNSSISWHAVIPKI